MRKTLATLALGLFLVGGCKSPTGPDNSQKLSSMPHYWVSHNNSFWLTVDNDIVDSFGISEVNGVPGNDVTFSPTNFKPLFGIITHLGGFPRGHIDTIGNYPGWNLFCGDTTNWNGNNSAYCLIYKTQDSINWNGDNYAPYK